jgi:hypothetical protein
MLQLLPRLSTKAPHFRGQTQVLPNLSTKNAKSVDKVPEMPTYPPKTPFRWIGGGK